MGLLWYMAKKIKTVWDRVNDYSRKNQSGLDAVSSFNGKIVEAIEELINYLVSIHGTNERANELLQPYIKRGEIESSDTGIFSKPEDFNYYLAASYNNEPVHKLTINQLSDYEQIPQRRGDLSKKRVNIAGVDNGWEARPAAKYKIKLYYVFNPTDQPNIVFTEQSTADEDLLVYDDENSKDFLFEKKCIPLITYMVLDKLGIEIRETMLTEYSQLGIAKENPAK